MSYSHSDLTKLAFYWLLGNQRCVVATSELTISGAEKPDALGWKTRGETVLIEAKASIADMRADADKRFRQYTDLGMGSRRYFAVNKNMEERAIEILPQGWGLLVPHGTGLRVICPSVIFKNNIALESQLLLSIIRRIAGRDEPLAGVGVKCFIHGLEHEASNTRLSVAPANLEIAEIAP